MYSNDKIERLAVLFKMFDDSTRLKILNVLMDRECCVGEISDLLDMSQSSISHQLRILKQSNLVSDRKDGKNVFYSIKDNCVKSIISTGIVHIEE